MSNEEMLTKEEIILLELHDSGLTDDDIAEKLTMDIPKTEEMIRKALRKRARLQTVAKQRRVPSYIRAIDERLDVTQKGTMKVGSQILKQLSEGIYSSPAASLKELISNSFDGDSTLVEIRITRDEVLIKDNGSGMNWSDFDQDFTYISRSIKRRERKETSVYHRPIIGFLGIGFISVSELCDTLSIKSCKKGDDRFFEAEIDFSKFRKPETFEKEFYEVSGYTLVNRLKKDHDIPGEASFTEIRLKNLRPGFKTIILDKEPFSEKGIGIMELLDFVSSSGWGITDLGKYWQMIWEMACMSPVRYYEGSIEKPIIDINDTLEDYNFKVRINGSELVKPIRFPISEHLEKDKYSIHPFVKSIRTSKGRLSFKGYIYSQHGIINPKEYIGIIIRVKNVAIGGVDRTLLGYPSGTAQLFRNWIFGEIYIEEGLEDALNINRNKFKVTDPGYTTLRDWLHDFLETEVFKYTLNEYYRKGRKVRQELREEQHLQLLDDIVKREMGSLYRLKYERLARDTPLKIDKMEKIIVINQNYTAFRVPAKIRHIMEQAFLIFEIAVQKSKGDVNKLRKIFLDEVGRWGRNLK